MTKEIQLTKGKVALVDDEDYEYINKWAWRYDGSYAVRTEPGKAVYMHRVIMNTQKGMEVDHINWEKLDNRKQNLRNCTRSQNTANRKITKANTSGYKGVTLDKDRNKWQAQIKINGKACYLGVFSSAKEAALEYDKKAIETHGNFAETNF